jgi:hypothetical protein
MPLMEPGISDLCRAALLSQEKQFTRTCRAGTRSAKNNDPLEQERTVLKISYWSRQKNGKTFPGMIVPQGGS